MMDFSQCQRLLDPAPMALETGWERLASGVLHVAVRTDMHGCTGEMLQWWFASGIGTREYRWWHPLDHVSSRWEHGTEGEVVGRTHVVEERFTGSPVQNLAIQFRDPDEFFGAQAAALARSAGHASAVLCIRGGPGPQPPTDAEGRVLGTRLIHVARDTPWGCALRSHFFLGQDMANANLPPAAIADVFTDAQAAPLLQHGYDEFTYLSQILPGLWLAEGADQARVARPW